VLDRLSTGLCLDGSSCDRSAFEGCTAHRPKPSRNTLTSTFAIHFTRRRRGRGVGGATGRDAAKPCCNGRFTLSVIPLPSEG
jgi:hypothetical protein